MVATDRENSFEDLEKFLTQLDWVPSQCSDDTESDVNFDSTHVEVESHIQDLEERALKEHLKSIVKDIHNAIGNSVKEMFHCIAVETQVAHMSCLFLGVEV